MAGQLEAAGRTRELLETCCGFLRIQTDENTYRTGSQRIEHVVTARHGQIDMREQLALVHDVKAVVAVVVGDIFRINICLWCGAERDTGAVDACNCLHGVGGVVVDDNGAVFRNQLAEAVERMNDIINVLEEVQMVCIDIEHNGNRRVEAEEGVGVLAGLSDEVIMRADAQRAAMASRLLPTMTVGSEPHSIPIIVSMEVVVVLPWVPDTQTACLYSSIILPHACARSITGMPSSRACAISGLSS